MSYKHEWTLVVYGPCEKVRALASWIEGQCSNEDLDEVARMVYGEVWLGRDFTESQPKEMLGVAFYDGDSRLPIEGAFDEVMQRIHDRCEKEGLSVSFGRLGEEMEDYEFWDFESDHGSVHVYYEHSLTPPRFP